MSNQKLFCFGYGYTCDYLGHELLQQGGWDVAGTTRDVEKRELLKTRNIEAHLFDWQTPLPDPLLALQDVTHLLISTPPSDDGDPTFLLHAEDILKLEKLQWIGYLSTTGVYGDRDGEWVDETSELRPSSQRGSRRKRAEAAPPPPPPPQADEDTLPEAPPSEEKLLWPLMKLSTSL